jgi:hypothetical protein
MILLNGCDFVAGAEITVKNETSYNLRISIYYSHPKTIELRKNESALVHVTDINKVPLPYEVIDNIIITYSNLDDDEIIKVIDKNLEDIFVLTKPVPKRSHTAKYSLTITDDLLQ